LVSTIASLDLDELEGGLAIKRELIGVEANLACKRDLSKCLNLNRIDCI
jgi:hypothetical protein